MYPLALLTLIAISITTRLLFIDSYPIGFSGHAIVHGTIRRRIYELLFINPWDSSFLKHFRQLVIQNQHGPQSLLEALLSPIFGFGLTESRLIVTTLALISIILAVCWGTVAISRLFGVAIGLAVALAPHHLAYSRNGDSEHINVYLHGFLLLLLAQQVVVAGRIRDWFLFGTALGLGLYVYASSQLLCLMTIALVMLFTLPDTLRLKSWGAATVRFTALSIPALLLASPVIKSSWSQGRVLPVRFPYGGRNYEFSQFERLPNQLKLTWQELFSRGTDPWFALADGCLFTWPTALAIPGFIYMACLAFPGLCWRLIPIYGSKLAGSRSIKFCFFIVCGMLIFGALPGALSPAPHFRRLTVLAIGIDILKGAGLLSMAMVSLKLLPRRLALAMIIVALATYTHSEWDTFYYKTKITESTARNTPIAIVRHITASLKDNKAVTVVTAGQGNLLSKRELIEILQFELGYPKQLPDGVKLLELAEVVSPIKDAVIPIDAYHSIKNGQLNPLPLVALDNERIFSNRLGKTHVITDLNPKAAS